jgi:hypothetical protein
MNSVQQFDISSLASLAILVCGSSSLIILLRAARGIPRSSSSRLSAIMKNWNKKSLFILTAMVSFAAVQAIKVFTCKLTEPRRPIKLS